MGVECERGTWWLAKGTPGLVCGGGAVAGDSGGVGLGVLALVLVPDLRIAICEDVG